MRIVVTGGNGFIGTELISQLVRHKTYEVHAIDRKVDRPFRSPALNLDHKLRVGLYSTKLTFAIGMTYHH